MSSANLGRDRPAKSANHSRRHRERIAPAGSASGEFFAMVHTPVPSKKIALIEGARDAVEAEWQKLEQKRAWMLETVREKSELMAEAQKSGETIHFGDLMALCHEKPSELPPELREYKGRVVLRGSGSAL